MHARIYKLPSDSIAMAGVLINMSTTKGKSKGKTDKLVKLVKANPNFTFLENGKIQCTLTGHELMPTLGDFETYQSGKAYKRALQSQVDIAGYERYLVNNRKDDRYFFCTLTGEKVLKKKSVVDKHVHGKRFKKKCKRLRHSDEEAEAELQNEQKNGAKVVQAEEEDGQVEHDEEAEEVEQAQEPAEQEEEQDSDKPQKKVRRKKHIHKQKGQPKNRKGNSQ